MGSILAIWAFVGAVIAAVVVTVLADECIAWLHWAVERLIRRAVRYLPENQRERYSEEWCSYLTEVPGEIGKFVSALGFLWAGLKMSRTASGQASQLSAESESAKRGPTRLKIVFGTPVPKDDVLLQAVDREIQAAKQHSAEIHNRAYFNARIAELADAFKPMCSSQVERGLLRTKLFANVDQDMLGQASAVKRHIALILGPFGSPVRDRGEKRE
jgi:hypothetical protein